MTPQDTYQTLVTQLKETAILGSISSLLDWDEHVYLPPRGADHRAAQASLLARKHHELYTSPRIDELLRHIESSDLIRDSESDQATVIRETRRLYDRAVKLPPSLVEEMAKTGVLAQQAWAQARAKSEFALFKPWLEKWVDLKRQQANCYGFTGHIYNALLENYEPGERAENLLTVFDQLRAPLIELIGKVTASGKTAPIDILQRSFNTDAQARFARAAAQAIGFDFQAGRLDISLHPFCSTMGPGDVRLTTRYDEHWFGDAFFGVLHEAGHGLYEQGLPAEHFGTPLGEAISLGIHESQSRLWENLVARSRAFWAHFLPQAHQVFGSSLDGVTDDQWYAAVNDIRPSLIRTEADEATYNLHILLRFELEMALLAGDLAVADLPAIWNARMKQYLGIDVPDDRQGCLQDIHWSGGSMGYFPTYTLGNLYAAQFFEQAKKDLGDLDAQFKRGEFAPLLNWLRQNIHRHGQRYRAADLVQRVTGTPLQATPLLDHLKRKAQEVYGV